MRPPRRLLSPLRTILIVLLLAAAAHPALPQSSTPPSTPLPPKWAEAVRALAEKIANFAGSSHEISLDVRNISSLSAVEVAVIRQNTQSELRHRGLLVTKISQSEMQVQVTLSEGTAGRVLVAEIRHGGEKQTVAITAPVETALINGRQRAGLTLAAKFVWKQPERFLDFALLDRVPQLSSILLVVEPARLAYYESGDLRWDFSRAIQIPHSRPLPRDIRGRIQPSENKIVLTDAECLGILVNADDMKCRSFGTVQLWVSFTPPIPGHERSLATSISENCNEGQILLTSGTGDWTQPDSLQAFERTQFDLPLIAVGNAISFEGPVISLMAEKNDAAARVVVHNLKTGNYEAYLVSAACSH